MRPRKNRRLVKRNNKRKKWLAIESLEPRLCMDGTQFLYEYSILVREDNGIWAVPYWTVSEAETVPGDFEAGGSWEYQSVFEQPDKKPEGAISTSIKSFTGESEATINTNFVQLYRYGSENPNQFWGFGSAIGIVVKVFANVPIGTIVEIDGDNTWTFETKGSPGLVRAGASVSDCNQGIYGWSSTLEQGERKDVIRSTSRSCSGRDYNGSSYSLLGTVVLESGIYSAMTDRGVLPFDFEIYKSSYLNVAFAVDPNLDLVASDENLKWLSVAEGGGVEFGYTISGEDLENPALIAFYWQPISGEGRGQLAGIKPSATSVGFHSGYISGRELAIPSSFDVRLLMRIDPNDSIEESNEQNNDASIAPTFAAEFFLFVQTNENTGIASKATKNEPYQVKVAIINHSAIGLPPFSITWTESFVSGEAKPAPTEVQDTISVEPIEFGMSRTVPLRASFLKNWDWIPEEFDGTLSSWLTLASELLSKRVLPEPLATLFGLISSDIGDAITTDPLHVYSYSVESNEPEHLKGQASKELHIEVSAVRKHMLTAHGFAYGMAAKHLWAGLFLLGSLRYVPISARAIVAAQAASELTKAAVWYSISQVLYELAKDPPDSDFEVRVGLPDYPGVADSITSSGYLSKLDNLVFEQFRYRFASLSARNKADGAIQSGDMEWYAIQLEDAAKFELEATFLQLKIDSLMKLHQLGDEREPTLRSNVTVDEIWNLLPSPILTLMNDTGLNRTDFEGFISEVQGLQSADLNDESLRELSSAFGKVSHILWIDQVVNSVRIRTNILGDTATTVADDALIDIDSNVRELRQIVNRGSISEGVTAAVEEQLREVFDLYVATKDEQLVERLYSAADLHFLLLSNAQTPAILATRLETMQEDGALSAPEASRINDALVKVESAFQLQSPAAVAASIEHLGGIVSSLSVQDSTIEDDLRNSVQHFRSLSGNWPNPWHNGYDTNGDLIHSAIDVLIVINYLNRQGSANTVTEQASVGGPNLAFGIPSFIDIDNNRIIDERDVNALIDFLNNTTKAEGERVDEIFSNLTLLESAFHGVENEQR